MSPECLNRVALVVGIFCVAMIASAVLYYGWYAIIVMLIGLFLFAAVISALVRALGGGNKGERG